jgi:hypothetical protein
MKTELIDANLSAPDTETTAAQELREAALCALAESELLLIGGGGGDVIWG